MTEAGFHPDAGAMLNADSPKPRIVRRRLDGVLLLDKPVGLSSTQAMAAAKRLFRAEKAGHTGTLDPFATGLLPVCFGEAAKFSRFLLDAEKSYRATLKLGEVSRTGDTEGEIIARRDVAVAPAEIDAALRKFVGPQLQTPPMHSALKQNGVPLYKLARQGLEVPREPRQITIFSLSLIAINEPELIIDTRVSKGTYIRVLAENIGETLGCGAHLTALRRTATGGFDIAQSVSIETLTGMTELEREQCLLPAQSLCMHLAKINLHIEDAHIFCNGGWIAAPSAAATETAPFAVYADDGRFLGVGEVVLNELTHGKARLVPMRLMATGINAS